MAITYDPVNKIIYNPDGSEVTPLAAADLYAASVGGGWGVVANPYPNVYEFLAKIYCNGGWLRTLGEHWRFINNGYTGGYIIYAYNGGGFLVGTKVATGAEYRAWQGSSIEWVPDGANVSPLIYAYNATMKLYGLALHGVQKKVSLWFDGASAVIDVLACYSPGLVIAPNCAAHTIKDVVLEDAINSNPFATYKSGGTYENILVHGQSYAAYIYAADAEISDSKFVGGATVMLVSYHGTSYLSNCDVYGTDAMPYTLGYDDTILVERKYWQPTVGYNVGDLFVPVAGWPLSIDDGKGNTIFSGVSNADGQYDFSTILTTWYAGYKATDPTIAKLVYRTIIGTSETVDDIYKNHVATFTPAGMRPKSYPIIMDRSRESDEVVFEPYTTPAIPVISTAEQTVTEPCIDLDGTATDADDIMVSVEVGGVEKARVQPVSGAWSCTIPLAAGANSVRAREINEEGTTSSYCGIKTFTYEQYTTPSTPVITTPEQTVGVPVILIEGTATDAGDILVEAQVGSVTKAKVDQEGGAWAAWLPLVAGPNQVRAREVNGGGSTSSWSTVKTYVAKIEHPTGISVGKEDGIITVKEQKSIKVVR